MIEYHAKTLRLPSKTREVGRSLQVVAFWKERRRERNKSSRGDAGIAENGNGLDLTEARRTQGTAGQLSLAVGMRSDHPHPGHLPRASSFAKASEDTGSVSATPRRDSAEGELSSSFVRWDVVVKQRSEGVTTVRENLGVS